MQIEPIGQRVLIKTIQKQNKTSSGIFLPESAKEEKKEGIVVSVGKKENGEPLPLNQGDHIIYSGFSAEDLAFNNQNYKVIDYKDIIAKVIK